MYIVHVIVCLQVTSRAPVAHQKEMAWQQQAVAVPLQLVASLPECCAGVYYRPTQHEQQLVPFMKYNPQYMLWYYLALCSSQKEGLLPAYSVLEEVQSADSWADKLHVHHRVSTYLCSFQLLAGAR